VTAGSVPETQRRLRLTCGVFSLLSPLFSLSSLRFSCTRCSLHLLRIATLDFLLPLYYPEPLSASISTATSYSAMTDALAPPPKNLHHALQDPGAHELGSCSLVIELLSC